MTLSTRGSILVDEYGRQRVLHGINLVDKGRPGSTDPRDFQGSWSERDLDQLVEIGLDAVRLGVIWAPLEPEPGTYSGQHLTWIGEQLDRLHQRGLAVILDGHQDLYSQDYSDGAPPWATLTDHPFEATELWSDAYLTSPAVHEAYDAFWADAPAADGVGIQTRFVALWGMLAQRFGDHPAVIGYDVLNEPTPEAQGAIRFATAGVPILFALLGLIPLPFLPYSREREMELSAWSQDRRPQEGTAVAGTARDPQHGDSPAPGSS
ncbi:cellulase family glycosylhydrolase [Brachybacterium muris]|uniref:Glycosyl hydrolase family 5 n=1 Tax=Brachybacterium muris UCD-AY4 TaxID=1249481 RepID=A0A022L186_9MICO|nr:cellulase family glycosylhydrolase [Brachybacterium muris]EYT49499.1 glycosyl hydrolase family 5 [Brachybacterium muris UCD-AY4]